MKSEYGSIVRQTSEAMRQVKLVRGRADTVELS